MAALAFFFCLRCIHQAELLAVLIGEVQQHHAGFGVGVLGSVDLGQGFVGGVEDVAGVLGGAFQFHYLVGGVLGQVGPEAIGSEEYQHGSGQALLAAELFGAALGMLANGALQVVEVAGRAAEGSASHDALTWIIEVVHFQAADAAQFQHRSLYVDRELTPQALDVCFAQIPGGFDAQYLQALVQPAAHAPHVAHVDLLEQVPGFIAFRVHDTHARVAGVLLGDAVGQLGQGVGRCHADAYWYAGIAADHPVQPLGVLL